MAGKWVAGVMDAGNVDRPPMDENKKQPRIEAEYLFQLASNSRCKKESGQIVPLISLVRLQGIPRMQ